MAGGDALFQRFGRELERGEVLSRESVLEAKERSGD